MKVLGISPLDKDATVSLVVDGRVAFAAAEERYSREKQHAGFPARALRAALEATGTHPDEIDEVAYAFLTAEEEGRLMRQSAREANHAVFSSAWRAGLRAAERAALPERRRSIPGLAHPNERRRKGPAKEGAYWLLGVAPGVSGAIDRRSGGQWYRAAAGDHARWQRELEGQLAALGLLGKLRRHEHHLSHAANAYHSSGFERALVVTLDGYGTGLHGSIGVGEAGRLTRLQNLRFPHSLGRFYEEVTAALGFKPDRHAGKIVGLAAYGDPAVLSGVLLERFARGGGDFRIDQPFNVFFCRYLAARFPMVDVAAAHQHVLELVACELVAYWLARTGCRNVVLSGGVTANVKMNQRIHELDGVEGIFIYPNMGDGGCGTGLAQHVSWPGGVGAPLPDVYFGPGFSENAVAAALDRAGLTYTRPNHLAAEVARHIDGGKVVARFDGRMEYGPRALGNRSILYHGRDASVNQWLNARLGRTEFMPFAPVTLWEARGRCYHGLRGAEHAAEFMTITFACTDYMRRTCPAAVHVDGTARPQLIRREVNPDYYDIVAEYERLSGIPSLINTSFNMHEEPIVCTPEDAVRAFLAGRLDLLAIGPFLVAHPGDGRG